jgi:hypothetical protein
MRALAFLLVSKKSGNLCQYWSHFGKGAVGTSIEPFKVLKLVSIVERPQIQNCIHKVLSYQKNIIGPIQPIHPGRPPWYPTILGLWGGAYMWHIRNIRRKNVDHLVGGIRGEGPSLVLEVFSSFKEWQYITYSITCYVLWTDSWVVMVLKRRTIKLLAALKSKSTIQNPSWLTLQ